ncbi:PEP/pyruvate-binding domain-containing protein [Nocardia sp. NPDC055029]
MTAEPKNNVVCDLKAKRHMTAPTALPPTVLTLRDSRAQDPGLTGAKAAALARASYSGLPVLDGFILTTAWKPPTDLPTEEWRRLSGDGARALVVRSSSTVEDGAEQSMAGCFTSVLDVKDWQAFTVAVDQVRASAAFGAEDSPHAPGDGMAILVQPFLRAVWGGVLFTADPISGRRDRMVLTAVRSGPSSVVDGSDAGWTATLTRGGRIRRVLTEEGSAMPIMLRRKIIRLASAAERIFGTPLDIEWALDNEGQAFLLQARPITAMHAPGKGPILGPGPLAETFPDPLLPLEQDLWLTPLADGLRVALETAGVATSRALRDSPIATSVEGIAVADLELLGVQRRDRPWLRKLDPRPLTRRLGASVRVGRLTAALPLLADHVCEQVDTDLAEVPALDQLGNRNLIDILHHSRTALTAVHGYEALASMLHRGISSGPTATAVALATLCEARAGGIDDEGITELFPTVLALSPPKIGLHPQLPLVSGESLSLHGDLAGTPVAREALRLRSRWIQELSARVAAELGRRLYADELLPSTESVALLHLHELEDLACGRVRSIDLAARQRSHAAVLPAEFRLAGTVPVAVTRHESTSTRGIGAGGGVGRGIVHIGDQPPPGAILVVRHLDPRLAATVPRLAGLIAETGSPLSHIAILAREHGVPVVVNLPDATRRLPDGAEIELDGQTGAVQIANQTVVAR